MRRLRPPRGWVSRGAKGRGQHLDAVGVGERERDLEEPRRAVHLEGEAVHPMQPDPRRFYLDFHLETSPLAVTSPASGSMLTSSSLEAMARRRT
jgi:hypothetical protein